MFHEFQINFVATLQWHYSLDGTKFKLKTHFTPFLFSVKPQNIQLLTNATSNQACLGSYLKFTCSVGSANPPVTSYELFKNDVVVDTSSSGMWIRMPPSSGEFTYKCLANNTQGTANSTSIIISVEGKYYIPLIVLFYFFCLFVS